MRPGAIIELSIKFQKRCPLTNPVLAFSPGETLLKVQSVCMAGSYPTSTMNQSDHSSHLQLLLRRVLADEEGAFDEFTMAVTDRLRNLAQSMLRRYPHVRRWEDTNDVMQAALIRLHQSINEVRPSSTREFFGLASTQIRRSLIDLARHYYGVYGVGTRHHSQGGGKAADDSGGFLLNAGTDDRPDSLEAWTGFHEAIDLLPADVQEVFSLIWYGGLMQKEVAKLLGIAEKTVMRRMTRARIRLHEILANQRPEMD